MHFSACWQLNKQQNIATSSEALASVSMHNLTCGACWFVCLKSEGLNFEQACLKLDFKSSEAKALLR